MLLNDLLKTIPITSISGNTDIIIESISFDTRTITQNSIFVCIKGINSDRHDFYKEAITKGATAIVSEYPLESVGDAANIVVENTNQALALISANFYENPEKNLRIVGVTGTNGKTTTTHLIKNVLEECGYKVGLIGTNEIVIGEEVFPSKCTTPEAPDLFGFFSQMKKASCDFVIMEVSSHSLALERVYGITFEAGIFTNLTQDHLDFHKTWEDYAKTKAKFFSSCKISILNADSDYLDIMKESASGSLATYGIENDCDYKAAEIEYHDDGITYTVISKKDPYKIKNPIPGKFSVYNSLSVCALCGELSIPDGFLRMALKKPEAVVKGRCEIVDVDTPFKVIIDYAHTPDGMVNILSAVNEFKKGRILTVFGCGGDRDVSKRPKMGKIAKDFSDIVIVTSDNPRSEDPDVIIEHIVAGIDDMTDVYTISDRHEAIRFGLLTAEEDDIVLLLGKGHETVQKFKDYEISFDEREVVKAICS